MSLIGIDVGSSSVKAVAYSVEGRALAEASQTFTPQRPGPGLWELDAEQVWRATTDTLLRVARARALRRDPPTTMAVSASGREIFPVDKTGRPLGPCIMAGDIRGAELAAQTASTVSRREWYDACGHIPERRLNTEGSAKRGGSC